MAGISLNDTFFSSVNIDLISSDASVSYSDTHKLFELNTYIEKPKNSHYLVGLTAFNMPFTFYQIRENINDRFTLTTFDGVTTLSETIIIPVGNYTMAALGQTLNTIFTGIKGSLGLTTMGISVNKSTSKYYMTCIPLMDTITFSDVICYKEIGMSSADYVYSSVSVLTFIYVVNLSSDSSLYCRLHNSDIVNLNTKNINGVLCNIPCDYQPTEIIYFNPSDTQFFRSFNFNSKYIEISILDQDFNDIAVLNTESPFRLTLSIHFSYNKPNDTIPNNIPIGSIVETPLKKKKKKKVKVKE